MILKLDENYLLRGWKGAGCGLVNIKTGYTEFFKPQIYKLLLLANGANDIDLDKLSEHSRDAVKGWMDKGIIIPCESVSPVSREQEYKLYDNRFIRSILWSVTGRCNFHCRHCYMDAPNAVLGEISHEEAISFIDQMAECGVFDIALTGGEPLVRSDIKELIQYISEKHIHISQIYSNGWLVDERLLEFLDGLGQMPEFNFSFDGVGWHDWLRGVEGAEQKVLRAIEMCQSYGFPTGVEGCLHKKSVQTLRETVKLMGKLNTRIKVGSIMQTQLWKNNSEGNAFTDEEYLEAMLKYIPQFFEDKMPANIKLGAVISLRKGSADYKILAQKYDGTEKCLDHKMCGAARACAYITPEGRLLPCMPMTSWSGHTRFKRIQDIGLKEGLTEGFYMNFVNGTVRELFENNKKCANCEYRFKCCGGCRAYALSDTDDLYASDPLNCLYWKNGYVDRIREVTEAAIDKYCR